MLPVNNFQSIFVYLLYYIESDELAMCRIVETTTVLISVKLFKAPSYQIILGESWSTVIVT